MKQMRYPNLDETEVYVGVVKEKDPPRNAHLESIQHEVFSRYETYLNDFEQLAHQAVLDLSTEEADALSHSWSSPTKSLKNIKAEIILAQSDEFKRICPYCLINRSTSFDHYFPQALYVEFTILGKNLIPCCTTCNGKKSSRVYDENGNRYTLHYFYDEIPEDRVLFATMSMRNGTPVAEFVVENREGLPAEIFEQISRHFETLGLVERYEREVSVALGNCRVDVRANQINDPVELKNVLHRKAQAEQRRYGENYYISSLYFAISDSDETINWLLS